MDVQSDKTKGLYAVLFVAILFCHVSCNTYNCQLETKVNCVYGFYASAREGDGNFVAGSAITVGDTITITAMGINTVLANKLVNKSDASVAVSYYGDVDSLLFTFGDEDFTGYDTVYVYKENIAHLDDPSCPAHMWHRITEVRSTRHLLDTVLISNPDINYNGLENLQLYFRIAEE